MSEYNINEDMPKSIFYYDDGKFYFQELLGGRALGRGLQVSKWK